MTTITTQSRTLPLSVNNVFHCNKMRRGYTKYVVSDLDTALYPPPGSLKRRFDDLGSSGDGRYVSVNEKFDIEQPLLMPSNTPYQEAPLPMLSNTPYKEEPSEDPYDGLEDAVNNMTDNEIDDVLDSVLGGLVNDAVNHADLTSVYNNPISNEANYTPVNHPQPGLQYSNLSQTPMVTLTQALQQQQATVSTTHNAFPSSSNNPINSFNYEHGVPQKTEQEILFLDPPENEEEDGNNETELTPTAATPDANLHVNSPFTNQPATLNQNNEYGTSMHATPSAHAILPQAELLASAIQREDSIKSETSISSNASNFSTVFQELLSERVYNYRKRRVPPLKMNIKGYRLPEVNVLDTGRDFHPTETVKLGDIEVKKFKNSRAEAVAHLTYMLEEYERDLDVAVDDEFLRLVAAEGIDRQTAKPEDIDPKVMEKIENEYAKLGEKIALLAESDKRKYITSKDIVSIWRYYADQYKPEDGSREKNVGTALLKTAKFIYDLNEKHKKGAMQTNRKKKNKAD